MSLKLSPQKFVELLSSKGLTKCAFIYNQNLGKFDSHPSLKSVSEEISKLPDLHHHEAIFLSVAPKSKVLQGAFIHRTHRGPAAGGVRQMPYDSMKQYFSDGLRLSKGMTHKNSLARLWWGGGKGVMCANTGVGLANGSEQDRAKVYQEYGSFMTELKGSYITAEDLGTHVKDMGDIFSKTRYTTCIPQELGGSGNPSIPTALGVVKALEAAFEYSPHSPSPTIDGATISVMGLGNVAMPMIQNLFDRGVKKVVATDIDPQKVERANKIFKDSGYDFEGRCASKDDYSVLYEKVDAVMPCAVGGILSKNTICNIQAPIICGAANNQLQHLKEDDKLIHAKNITYIPDFLANRMGIVNCADEDVAVGYYPEDPFLNDHLEKHSEKSIYLTTKEVLLKSADSNKTPQDIALAMAEKLSFEEHPIWGHRWMRVAKFVGENSYGVKPEQYI